MTLYVCSQLSQPDSNGIQTCMVWVEQQPILPPLSQAEADAISAALLSLFASVHIGRRVLGLIR